MKPKTDLAIKAMQMALREFDFSDQELFDATFHLTDWIDDLKNFVSFLEEPEKYDSDAVQTLLIAFLIHAPDHLAKAAEIVLGESTQTRIAKPAKRQKRPRK
jgi:hypothetical protein